MLKFFAPNEKILKLLGGTKPINTLRKDDGKINLHIL